MISWLVMRHFSDLEQNIDPACCFFLFSEVLCCKMPHSETEEGNQILHDFSMNMLSSNHNFNCRIILENTVNKNVLQLKMHTC